MISYSHKSPPPPPRCVRIAGQANILSGLPGTHSLIERDCLQASPRQSFTSLSFINIKTQMKEQHHGKVIRSHGKAIANV